MGCAGMVASLHIVIVQRSCEVPKKGASHLLHADGHGMMHTARAVAAKEGLPGFFKGWLPSYVRIGPQVRQ